MSDERKPKEPEDEEDAGREILRGLRIAGVAIPKTIPIVVKLGGVYVRYKIHASRAAKSFEKELVAQGLDKEIAKELAEVYRDGSRFEGFDNEA